MKNIAGLFVLIMLVVITACNSGSNENGNNNNNINNPNLKEMVVEEVIQTTSYTYLKFQKGEKVSWGAIPKREDIEVGSTYYYEGAMEMKNFQSKELNKTFESVYFLESISNEPYPEAGSMIEKTKGSPKIGDMEVGNIEPIEGGITIGELYKNKKEYAGKEVKIHGLVVKYTSSVMGKNWVHIQDGTKYGDKLDITITTSDVVDNGDIVTFEGTVFLDKDFGYGYKYDVIIEDAKLIDVDHSKHM